MIGVYDLTQDSSRIIFGVQRTLTGRTHRLTLYRQGQKNDYRLRRILSTNP